jgi:hypothetical protein
MDKNKDKLYAPKERGYLEQNPQNLKSYSKKDYTIMPDTVQDPIVSQNIAWGEFDYTSNELLHDDDDETSDKDDNKQP